LGWIEILVGEPNGNAATIGFDYGNGGGETCWLDVDGTF
jgi:hypothetical protein